MGFQCSNLQNDAALVNFQDFKLCRYFDQFSKQNMNSFQHLSAVLEIDTNVHC